MKKEYSRPERPISLKDQDFLKELGMTGLSPGLEYLLRQQETTLKAMAGLEAKADGLQSLGLDEKTLAELGRDTNLPVSELREELRLFRDLETLDTPEDS